MSVLERTDADIATDVVRALELRSSIPNGVQATVHGGHVSLTGKVYWQFQETRRRKGAPTVASGAVERDVRHRIVQALHRNANVDARHITVTVSGDQAILTGQVGTWLQRESAERAAADAPGIARVDNRIAVEPRPSEEVPDEMC